MRLAKLSMWLAAAAAWAAVARGAETRTVLLVGQSPDNHPPGTHEYLSGLKVLSRELESTADLKVELTNGDEPWDEGPARIERADGVVLFVSEGARWTQADPRRHEALRRLAARGGGLAALHWALGTRGAEPIGPYLQLLGGCHGGPDRKYQVVETQLQPVDPRHPITAGIQSFNVRDEFYYRLKFVPSQSGVQPLVTATIDGQSETVAWAWERPGGGRSFGFSGLHFHQNWERSEYRTLIRRAVLWTLGLPPQTAR